jgi:tRNA(His) guanylyltransferase
MSKGTGLGDRIKGYEARETKRSFIPGIPVVVRLDGKRFSKFTKNMEKPFDAGFTDLMVLTTHYLVEQTGARIGYTQSDEITLIYLQDKPKSEIYLNGRVQKMTSILASMATGYFNDCRETALQRDPGTIAMFDCRAFQVPSKDEAVNVLIWRELDAARNSVSMLANHYFSHKELQGKNVSQVQDLLMGYHQVNWNDLKVAWKRGTYVQRETYEAELSDAAIAKILAKCKDGDGRATFLEGKVTRHRIANVSMPKLTTVTNRVAVVFDAEKPVVEQLQLVE